MLFITRSFHVCLSEDPRLWRPSLSRSLCVDVPLTVFERATSSPCWNSQWERDVPAPLGQPNVSARPRVQGEFVIYRAAARNLAACLVRDPLRWRLTGGFQGQGSIIADERGEDRGIQGVPLKP